MIEVACQLIYDGSGDKQRRIKTFQTISNHLVKQATDDVGSAPEVNCPSEGVGSSRLDRSKVGRSPATWASGDSYASSVANLRVLALSKDRARM